MRKGAYIPDLETMDAVVEVSGMVPHEWTLWPPQMIDAMFKAIDTINADRRDRGKEPLAVASTRCNHAPDGKWYVQITLQTALFVEPWTGPAPVPGKLLQ